MVYLSSNSTCTAYGFLVVIVLLLHMVYPSNNITWAAYGIS